MPKINFMLTTKLILLLKQHGKQQNYHQNKIRNTNTMKIEVMLEVL